MGEVIVSCIIGGCLIVSGILMNVHLKREQQSIRLDKLDPNADLSKEKTSS